MKNEQTMEERFDAKFDYDVHWQGDEWVAKKLKKFIKNELALREQEIVEAVKELVDALEGMYDQYCDDGHHFMSAGERAESVLKEYGYKFDGGGAIKKRPKDLLATITKKD